MARLVLGIIPLLEFSAPSLPRHRVGAIRPTSETWCSNEPRRAVAEERITYDMPNREAATRQTTDAKVSRAADRVAY
jgi:hypothetical protein